MKDRLIISLAPYTRVREKLSEPHRHWHTYDRHVAPMIEQISRDALGLYDPFVVFLAALYHDSVYFTDDTVYADNEFASAQFMRRELAGEVPEQKLAAAELFILATQSHVEESVLYDLDQAYHEDLRYFLDLDVGIFRQDPALVLEFERDIRKEFSQYEDQLYYPGRKAVLEKFAARDHIYVSKRFEDSNQQAKVNLNFLISKLDDLYHA